MQQPIIHSGEETAICNSVTVRVVVLIVHRHIIAAAHDESAEAVVRTRCGRRRHNVLADDVFAFLNRWIDFHDRSAIRVRVGANLIHPTLQVFTLHDRPRETDLIHRRQLFRRNRIKNMRKSSDGLVTQDGEG